MISEWLLMIVCVAWPITLFWHGRMAYRHGIWDGAFNHFLPIVKREMLFYDERRAKMIFEDEDAT